MTPALKELAWWWIDGAHAWAHTFAGQPPHTKNPFQVVVQKQSKTDGEGRGGSVWGGASGGGHTTCWKIRIRMTLLPADGQTDVLELVLLPVVPLFTLRTNVCVWTVETFHLVPKRSSGPENHFQKF